MFEGSKAPLRKWFMAIYLITSHKKGISSLQLAKDISVTQRLRGICYIVFANASILSWMKKLDGEIELDETFVGGKNKYRHKNKKVKNCQGRSFKDKVPVMGMLQRGGKVVCKVVRDTSYKSLTVPILKAIDRSATLFSDEWLVTKPLINCMNIISLTTVTDNTLMKMRIRIT